MAIYTRGKDDLSKRIIYHLEVLDEFKKLVGTHHLTALERHEMVECFESDITPQQFVAMILERGHAA